MYDYIPSFSPYISFFIFLFNILWYIGWVTVYIFYKTRFFIFLALLYPVFIVTFKDIMTPDLYRYALMFEAIEDFNYPIEPIYIALSLFLKSLGLSYHSILSVYSLLVFILIYLSLTIYDKKVIPVSFYLFLQVPGFYLNLFVEVRQLLAVSFVFLGVVCYTKKRYVIFFLSIFLSIASHYTSLFFWLIFAVLVITRLLKTSLSILQASLLSAISLIVGLVLSDSLLYLLSLNLHYIASFFPYAEKYLFLLDIVKPPGTFETLKIVYYNFILLVVLYTLRKLSHINSSELNPYLNPYLNLFSIGVFILNLSFHISEMARLAYYFFIFQIVVLPSALFYIKREYKLLFYKFLVIIFFLQYIKGLFFYSEEAGDYIFLHYRNYLINLLLGD